MKKEALIHYLKQRWGEHPSALSSWSHRGSGMLELMGMVFPKVVPASPGGKQEGPPRPLVPLTHGTRGAFGAVVGCTHRLPRHSTAPKQSHAQRSTPITWRGKGGLQTTSYSLRAGNSASFYQTPHQSFYISLPSAGSEQTLHPLPGSRIPCASCSAPVTFGEGTGQGRGVSGREEVGGKSNRRRTKQKKNI